jgi:hypothetical protein
MKSFQQVVACIGILVALALIALAPIAHGQAATSLDVTVSPTKFSADKATDVTVAVLDQTGTPVAGAAVIIYEADAQSADPSTAWVGNGTTDANGRVVIRVTPRHDSQDIFVRVTSGAIVAYSGPYDINADGGWLDQICFVGAMAGAIVFLAIMLIMIIGTLVFWTKYTFGKAAELKAGSLAGAGLKLGDEKSDASALTHVDGIKAFSEWKAAILSNKDALLFIPKKFLESMKIVSMSKHYGGVMRSDEVVESPSEDTVTQKLSAPHKIHQDPKPVPPSVFKNDVQHYPVSERTIGCGNCASTGKVTCSECKGSGAVDCPPCSGKGTIPCSSCRGSGHIMCAMCGGAGKKSEQQSAGQDVTKVVDSNGREVRRYTTQYHTATVSVGCSSCGGSGNRTCSKCNGRGGDPCKDCRGSGKVRCDNCSATGKVTCSVCDGSGQVRELRRKVWTYSHETLRQGVGEVGDRDRYDGILGTSRVLTSEELAKPDAISTDGASSSASPSPAGLAKSGMAAHEKWVGREKGKLILAKHEMQVAPVTKSTIQYLDKGKPKTFTLWAIGNPKNWALSVMDFPTRVSMRLVGRHVLAMVLLVAEIFVLVYAFLIAGWFW